jgi:hypothetical protein
MVPKTSPRLLLSVLGTVPILLMFTLAAALLVLMATFDVAFAREFGLVTGKQRKVCQEVLRRINGPEARAEDVRFFLAKLFPKPPLQEGQYVFRNEKGTGLRTVNVGELDVNNDGRTEVLAFYTTTFRSDVGEQLLVLNKGEVDFFAQHPEFTYDQFQHLNGIRSITPWPYMEHNLFLVTIGFWRFEDVNYVALWDNRLHQPGMARALVIAKYTGIPIQPRDGWATDRLDVVCKIM